MESPVVVDKPPEYHGNSDRGFPFDEEEGSGAWSELAARHPDIAARLRQRPATATWARKRRPSSQDATEDFGDSFGGFDRFPFDDIPPEFREHFPTHWNRRYSSREEPQPEAQEPQPSPQPQQNTAATQTEQEPTEEPSLPQYGLRNTVDLGQKSPADPSLVDGDDRNQRSMSAPPDTVNPNTNPNMSANHHEQAPHQEHSNVRHIPIFVEGRDEPVINKSVDHGTHFGETKPPPPQPHIDREQYFADDGPHGFHHPPNFTRAFGTPFKQGFRQGPQPFVQQKAYPQNAFARGASPQRAQSPKQPVHEEFVKVPVHQEHAAPKTEPHPSKQQHQQQQQQQQQQQKQPSPQPQPQREQTPPKPQPTSNDPITQILSIQTDVLNLMTEVENFKGTKKDKRYMFLDEMLTRNLIKLDNIETEGKENIRQARKEAIKCIQKCIAVLEAKADSNAEASNAETSPAQPQDVEMKENVESAPEAVEPATENGEVEMKEAPKEPEKVDTQEPQRIEEATPEVKAEEKREPTPKPQEEVQEQKPEATDVEIQPPAADTRPEEPKTEEKQDEQKVETKPSPKKKVVKKRDKSKDSKAAKEEASKDSNKTEEVMQVDDKGDKVQQVMEVDGAASQ